MCFKTDLQKQFDKNKYLWHKMNGKCFLFTYGKVQSAEGWDYMLRLIGWFQSYENAKLFEESIAQKSETEK